MSTIRCAIPIAFAALFTIAQSHAAPVNDPLAAIDLNRNAIIADIVHGFDGDRAVLASRLAALRADRLLSASLTSTRESLLAIIDDAEMASNASMSRASAKALGNATADLVYTPLTPCRLVDTRGFGAPIQGGVFAPNARRGYIPQGQCGLPTANVASMLISFTTQNLTPNSGGYLAILAPNAPVTASVDVFNLGSEWSASNTAVITGPAAQFDVLVAVASAHVIIDILGYFAPPSGGLNLDGNITLVNSTASAGNILKGTSRFIHNTGTINTFVGETAGTFSGGAGNSGFGAFALSVNTGAQNTAVGAFALAANSTGQSNVAVGRSALVTNSTSFSNTAVGASALVFSTGGSNIGIGSSAGGNLTNGSFNIAIGNPGVAGEGNTIRIGDSANQTRAFIAGIRSVTTASAAIPVLIDTNGQLGTTSSSRRFKDDIADMDASSEALMKLRPVTFHYKADKGSSGAPLQYGLIAEEVAEVYPGLVAHSADGQVETVMYQYLPTMMLNEMQKQQRVIEDLKSQVAKMARKLERLGSR